MAVLLGVMLAQMGLQILAVALAVVQPEVLHLLGERAVLAVLA
jgi:hypothetical protein